MNRSIIEQVFMRNIITTIIITCFLIAILFLIRFAVKEAGYPKWSYLVWGIVTLVVVTVLCNGLIEIYTDINTEDYITYEGVYIERGGGQMDLKTIVVYDIDGNEVRLLRTGKSVSGEYIGTVIYGRRSKIVVEYYGEHKAQHLIE